MLSKADKLDKSKPTMLVQTRNRTSLRQAKPIIKISEVITPKSGTVKKRSPRTTKETTFEQK